MKRWTSTGVKKREKLNIKMYKVMHKWVPIHIAWVVSGLK